MSKKRSRRIRHETVETECTACGERVIGEKRSWNDWHYPEVILIAGTLSGGVIGFILGLVANIARL